MDLESNYIEDLPALADDRGYTHLKRDYETGDIIEERLSVYDTGKVTSSVAIHDIVREMMQKGNMAAVAADLNTSVDVVRSGLNYYDETTEVIDMYLKISDTVHSNAVEGEIWHFLHDLMTAFLRDMGCIATDSEMGDKVLADYEIRYESAVEDECIIRASPFDYD